MKRDDFETWMKKVNAFIERKTGFGIDDLPDWDYWNAWNDGMPPSQAAYQVIQAARDY